MGKNKQSLTCKNIQTNVFTLKNYIMTTSLNLAYIAGMEYVGLHFLNN